MIKKFLRRLATAIYKIGEFETSQQKAAADREKLRRSAQIDKDAILEGCEIFNNQDDRSKISIGYKSVIKGELLLFKHGGKITIGAHCFVGPGSRIWSARHIKIGDRVLISHDVNIHDNISHPLDAKLRHEDVVHIFSKGFQESVDLREAEVIIEDDAWIGFNAIILKGVRIGQGAIVGAGTIVTADVPPFSVVVGNPARVVKTIEQ